MSPFLSRFLLLACALGFALAVTGCAGGDDGEEAPANQQKAAAPDKGKPILIGVEKGLTGPWARFEVPGLLGARIAVDEINASGGVLGRQLKLVICDTKSDVALSGTCALEVIEKGAEVLLTTPDFDWGGPAARVANDHEIVAISSSGGVGYGAQGIGPFVYNTWAGTPTEGAVMAEYSHKTLGFRKPYLLGDVSSEYSKGVCRFFEQRWNEVAGEGSIAGKDTFLFDDPSIAAQVTRIKSAADADSIVLCSYPPAGVSALRQIRAAGIDLPIMGAAAFDGTYWVKSVPGLSDFHHPVAGNKWGDPLKNPLVDEIIKRTGKPPATILYSLLDYGAIYMMKTAIEGAGSTDGDKMRAVLDKFKDEPLPFGRTTYTPNCHISFGRAFAILKYENGQVSYVEDYKPEKWPKSQC